MELLSADEMPLYGRRVMITAPRQYATKLAGKLIEAGACPVWLPAVQITTLPPAELLPLMDSLRDLDSFTHLAFTSKNGIAATLAALEAMHGGPQAAADALNRSKVKICALGADGDALKVRTGTCLLTGAASPAHYLTTTNLASCSRAVQQPRLEHAVHVLFCI